MSAIITKIKREDLLQEIIKILNQWSDIDRKIFTRSHYLGQSLETIALSFKLDMKQVTTILKQCDDRLRTSLKRFRENNLKSFHMAG